MAAYTLFHALVIVVLPSPPYMCLVEKKRGNRSQYQFVTSHIEYFLSISVDE
jgi:hypothetical protein